MIVLPVLWFVLWWWKTVNCPHKLHPYLCGDVSGLLAVMLELWKTLLENSHREMPYTSYLAWMILYGESLVGHMLYLVVCIAWCDMCVFYHECYGIGDLWNDGFHHMCKLFQSYYVTFVETCLPYSDVLLKDLVLSVFLFYYCVLHCIAPNFCFMCTCFHLNLVVAVDYYHVTFCSIFLGNSFLN